jgi:VanZ family protein
MKRTDKRLRLNRLLTVLLLCFIWGNSMLPGEISGRLSDWVKSILAMLLPGDVPGVTTGGGLLRKIAHFSEFAMLGMCLTWRLGMLEKKKILALVYGFGVACMDELIQRFVPNRGPSLRDVAIDTCGVAAGICLLLLAHKFVRNQKTSKENELL